MVPPSPATGLEAEYRGHTVWQETQATCEHFQHEPAINLPYLHPTPQKGTHMKLHWGQKYVTLRPWKPSSRPKAEAEDFRSFVMLAKSLSKVCTSLRLAEAVSCWSKGVVTESTCSQLLTEVAAVDTELAVVVVAWAAWSLQHARTWAFRYAFVLAAAYKSDRGNAWTPIVQFVAVPSVHVGPSPSRCSMRFMGSQAQSPGARSSVRHAAPVRHGYVPAMSQPNLSWDQHHPAGQLAPRSQPPNSIPNFPALSSDLAIKSIHGQHDYSLTADTSYLGSQFQRQAPRSPSPSYAQTCNPNSSLLEIHNWPSLSSVSGPAIFSIDGQHPNATGLLTADAPSGSSQLQPQQLQMPDPLDDFDMSLSPMSLGQPDLLDTHLGPSPPVQDDFAQMFSDAVGGNSVPDILFAMAPAVDDAAAEVFCRQLGGYLHLVAQWGWCELQDALQALSLEARDAMQRILGQSSWEFVIDMFGELAWGGPVQQARFLQVFSVLTTPGRTPSGPFRRVNVALQMTAQELVVVAGRDVHSGPASVVLSVFRKSYPDEHASAMRAHGNQQLRQPVSAHRQNAAAQLCSDHSLYDVASEALWGQSRQQHQQLAWERSHHKASAVTEFLDQVLNRIKVHAALSFEEKEALSTDLRHIYNNAYGRHHKPGSVRLALKVLREEFPLHFPIIEGLADTHLRGDHTIDDASVSVTGRALATQAAVVKVMNRLYPEPRDLAEREAEKKWREPASHEAATLHKLIQADLRFHAHALTRQFFVEHTRDGAGTLLEIEIRDAPFEPGRSIHRTVAEIDAGTLVITHRVAESTDQSWNDSLSDVATFIRVFTCFLQSHQMQSEFIQSPNHEAWYAAMAQVI